MELISAEAEEFVVLCKANKHLDRAALLKFVVCFDQRDRLAVQFHELQLGAARSRIGVGLNPYQHRQSGL